MARALAALAAWLGGTATAVCLAWFGAGLVVRNTTASPADPVVPVTSIAPPAHSSAPARPDPVRSRARPRPPGSSHRRPRPTSSPPSPSPSSSPSASASASASASPSGVPHSYTLAGGQVTLLLTGRSARLVTAVPNAGFAVQRWSAPGWLRVDFSSGSRVSSLIVTWNGHPPSVVTTN